MYQIELCVLESEPLFDNKIHIRHLRQTREISFEYYTHQHHLFQKNQRFFFSNGIVCIIGTFMEITIKIKCMGHIIDFKGPSFVNNVYNTYIEYIFISHVPG